MTGEDFPTRSDGQDLLGVTGVDVQKSGGVRVSLYYYHIKVKTCKDNVSMHG